MIRRFPRRCAPRSSKRRVRRTTPVIRTAALDDGSTAVYVVTRTRVADAGANPALASSMNEQLQQRSAQGEVAAYVNEAKRKAKIVKNPGVFE